ncbi:MAG TPA: PaaI family thioesterase, partial [Deltaproteobacteria bacterium]|nr:PaaI family thioesterase [Deltaproteobacteria bacterium]
FPVSFGEGKAVFEMEAGSRHHNPMGTVHGGILCDIADAAMGFAFASTLGPGETFTTLELKINFLRPVVEGRLTASARVAHRGRTIGMVECDVVNSEGKPVARAASTCQVLRGEAARGR